MEAPVEIALINQELSSIDEHQILVHLSLDSDSTEDANTKEILDKCEVLNLHCNKLSSLEGLTMSLNFLTDLNLSSNNFSICDLPELAFLPALQRLDLSGNKLTSLFELPFMPGLKSLFAAHNFIRSVYRIDENVPSLEILDIRGNEISKWEDLVRYYYLLLLHMLIVWYSVV